MDAPGGEGMAEGGLEAGAPGGGEVAKGGGLSTDPGGGLGTLRGQQQMRPTSPHGNIPPVRERASH